MITHSATFEALAKAPIKRTDVIVALQDQYEDGSYHDNPYSIWKSSDKLIDVKIDSVGSFLGTTTKKAVIRLMGVVSTAAPEQLYQIRTGLYNAALATPAYEYISQGFYAIDNIAYDYDAGSTTITLYDAMWDASQTAYSAGVVTFPMTVLALAQGIAQAIGLTLDPNFSNLPNADYVITDDLYVNINGATLQTVVAELAATTGTTARVSDRELKFVKYNVQDERLNSTLLKTLKLGKFYGPITSVVLGRVPQNDNVVIINSPAIETDATEVDPVENTITIPGNGLTSGTLIQITSSGTMPGGVNQYYNYYAHMMADPDKFQIMETHFDALNGINPVEITSAGTGLVYLTILPSQEIQINNVEIMDDDRALLLPPLFGELLGAGWYGGKADTIGLPWHEVGDAILFQQNETNLLVPVLLTEVHLVFAGSIKETLVSEIPNQKGINPQTAGGILKTLYNTEIKVDKQNNDITSIVSRQDADSQTNAANFTEVYQTVDAVRTQIQSVGGGNLILNSVGYAKETDGRLSFWTKTGSGNITSYSSAGSLSSGATSGNAIQLVGVAGTQITQRLQVANNEPYSLGFRVNKTLGNGSAVVRLTNNITTFEIPIEGGTGYQWTELKLTNLQPGQNYWDITIAITGTTSSIEITDLRVMSGPTLVQWDQSHSEILNSQVALTTEGIRVSRNGTGDYTVMTPIEFAGYSDASGSLKKVFWINRETTEVENVYIKGATNYGDIIRAIPIKDGPVAGLAFVGVSN
jgi:hypothetical protein